MVLFIIPRSRWPLTSGASASVYNKLLMNVAKRKRKFEKIRGFLYCGF